MKKSEIAAAAVMVGLLIFGGVKFGSKNIGQPQLKILIEASSKLADGEKISRTEEKKLEGILDISPANFIHEDPAHTTLFSSILDKLSFAISDETKDSLSSPGEISNKLYLKYLKIIRFALYSGKVFLLASLFVIIIVPLLNKVGLYRLTSFLGRALFLASRIFLILLAAALLSAWIVIKSEFWVPVNISIFGPSVVLLGAAAAAVKLHDPNFPLWNRVMKTLILPFVMSFIIVGSSIFFVESA